ncbi:hypothetical protein FQR65_LT20682 [Abscondita terminalis]|nr:hypothetical protein FQR65_LT20682 [Abscondita terminalis]
MKRACRQSAACNRNATVLPSLQLKEQAHAEPGTIRQQLLEAEADEAALAEKLDSDMRHSYLKAKYTRLTNAIAALGAVQSGSAGRTGRPHRSVEFLDATQMPNLTEPSQRWKMRIAKIEQGNTPNCWQDTFDKVQIITSANCSLSCFGAGGQAVTMNRRRDPRFRRCSDAQPPVEIRHAFCLLDEVDAPSMMQIPNASATWFKRMSAYTPFLVHTPQQQDCDGNGATADWCDHAGAGCCTYRGSKDMESAAEFAAEAQTALSVTSWQLY